MKLYTFFNSSSSYRVRVALNLKNLKPEMAYVTLTRGEHRDAAYAAVNTQMIVPTLVDGGRAFSQSLAIMEYLEERYPAPPILPQEPAARAYVRELALMVACDTSPLGNLKVRKYLESQYGKSRDEQQAWIQHWYADGLAAFEKILARSPQPGAFCYGDTPTMADCCITPQAYAAQRFTCDMTPYPHIMRIVEACNAHPAFAAAHPAKQADAA